jgi:WD40 repeat protein
MPEIRFVTARPPMQRRPWVVIALGAGVVACAGLAVLVAVIGGLFDRDSELPGPRAADQPRPAGGTSTSRIPQTPAVPPQDGELFAAVGPGPFRRLANPPGPDSTARGLAFNRDGTVLAAADEDGVVRVWDVPAASLRLSYKRHAGMPSSVTLTPDGKTAVSVGQDNTLRVWDTSDGKERLVLKKDVFPPSGAACSPDGKTLAWGAFNNVRLWDLATVKQVGTLTGHRSYATRMTFLPDGELLVVGDDRGDVKVWDYRARKLMRAFHANRVVAAVAPDGKTIASIASMDYNVHLWDVAIGRHTRDVPDTEVEGVAFSPDGTMVATAGDHLHVWKLATMEPLATLGKAGQGYKPIVFSADGKRLAAGSIQGVHVWELAQPAH